MKVSKSIGIVLPKYNDLVVEKKNTISRLKKIYSKLFKHKNINFYWHDFNCGISDLTQLSLELLKDCPEKLIVSDATHHPYQLLKQLFYNPDYNPELYIDIVGNLIDKPTSWRMLGQLLQEKQIKTQILTSTKAQEKFINQFLHISNYSKTFAKPILNENIFFDANKRDIWRKDNNISSDEFVILASGDLSIDSNFVIALKEIYNNFSASRKKMKLIILGKHKDNHISFWNIKPQKGNSFHQLRQIFKSSIGLFVNNICYIPTITSDHLPYLLNGIDCCINLSLNQVDPLHHLPAIQALACGTNCITSNWGNINQSNVVKKVNVKITNSGINIDRPQVSSYLTNFLNEFYNLSNADRIKQRENISKNTLLDFSTNKIVKDLKMAFCDSPPPFVGFNWKMEQIQTINLFSEEYSVKGSLYNELYSEYS